VTIIDAGELRLKVARVVDVAAEVQSELTLSGKWAGLEKPVELAAIIPA
jgi:hypothetical protein